MNRGLFALYGFSCTALFLVLGPFILLLWLIAGVAAGLSLHVRASVRELGLPAAGYIVTFAAVEAEIRWDCRAPLCQTTPLGADLLWLALTGAMILAASAALALLGGRRHRPS